MCWTFSAGPPGAGRPTPVVALGRFLVTALTGLAANTAWVATLVALGADPLAALVPMMIITPTCTFVMSRYWAFR
jgi:putative flippase GtrA